MDKLEILFMDHPVSQAKTEAVFREKGNYLVFNFHEKFREASREDSALGKEIRMYLDRGEWVPLPVFQKLLSIHLDRLKGQKLLLARFPGSDAQFRMLEDLLRERQMEIGAFWYVSLNDQDIFTQKYFQKPEQQMWIQKFGDEALQRNSVEYTERKALVLHLQKKQGHIPWHILEINDESEIEEKLDTILKIR